MEHDDLFPGRPDADPGDPGADQFLQSADVGPVARKGDGGAEGDGSLTVHGPLWRRRGRFPYGSRPLPIGDGHESPPTPQGAERLALGLDADGGADRVEFFHLN